MRGKMPIGSRGRWAARLKCGLSPTAEHVLDEGYSVDYALVGERIAIEVDGPGTLRCRATEWGGGPSARR